MKPLTRLIFAGCLLVFTILANAETSPGDNAHQVKPSTSGLFEVTIDSQLKPLQLGRMHTWIAVIRTAEGQPVEGASIKVGGGMPIHNHGFPTEPEVTKELEPGVYLIEGIKFSMRGPWVILLDIEANGQTDSVAFNIGL